MKELVVISGKGGTGKTSIVASFAALADDKVIADCDVDASNLHILLHPKPLERYEFKAEKKAFINKERCTTCGLCYSKCRFNAISKDIEINEFLCEGCGLCAAVCLEDAITLKEQSSGYWLVSDTDYGPFVYAQLRVAQENSGMLVASIRGTAKGIAEEKKLKLIIIDGPPGIGCPVISSITGSDLVFIITEPTLSALSDAERV
ncbi:MAG: (4Fe-4S)-binding protein, partial [Nitrospirae bacterium]